VRKHNFFSRAKSCGREYFHVSTFEQVGVTERDEEDRRRARKGLTDLLAAARAMALDILSDPA